MATPRDQFSAAHGEKAARAVDRELLANVTRSLGEQLRETLRREGVADMLGFTLVMFLRLLDELRGKLAAAVPGARKGD